MGTMWQEEPGEVAMSGSSLPENDVSSRNSAPQRNTYLAMTSGIQVLIVIGLVLFVLRRDWENVFLTIIVMGLTLVPAFLFRRQRVLLPPEFQLIAATFIFLSLFLRSHLCRDAGRSLGDLRVFRRQFVAVGQHAKHRNGRPRYDDGSPKMTQPTAISNRDPDRWIVLVACIVAVLMSSDAPSVASQMAIPVQKLQGWVGNYEAAFTTGVTQLFFVVAVVIVLAAMLMWFAFRSPDS